MREIIYKWLGSKINKLISNSFFFRIKLCFALLNILVDFSSFWNISDLPWKDSTVEPILYSNDEDYLLFFQFLPIWILGFHLMSLEHLISIPVLCSGFPNSVFWLIHPWKQVNWFNLGYVLLPKKFFLISDSGKLLQKFINFSLQVSIFQGEKFRILYKSVMACFQFCIFSLNLKNLKNYTVNIIS